MSRGGNTRFSKGQSGNPKGRPKQRRPHVSAFDIIFDKTLTVTVNDVERELTIEEALQLRTYQAALKGSKMAVRTILKMIEKREAALARRSPRLSPSIRVVHEHDALNAHAAMQILGIAAYAEPASGEDRDLRDLHLATWAAQHVLSRPGRRCYSAGVIAEIRYLTLASDQLRWPRGTRP